MKSITSKKPDVQDKTEVSFFLINLQKMVFVTRFVEAFKGYIRSYFGNLEHEIGESFGGFWKVTVDDQVYIR